MFERVTTLVAFDRRQLYFVRPIFGDTIQDCVSFALSAEYHQTGALITPCKSLGEVAVSVDKILILYRHSEMDVQAAGNGVGYIYLHEDLDGNISLIAWKDENNRHVLISNGFSDRGVRPRWKD